MLLGWLSAWLRRKMRLECNHDRDRLERAQALHVMSIDAVKASRRKQARRLSDVRTTVEATLRQMEERSKQRERENP